MTATQVKTALDSLGVTVDSADALLAAKKWEDAVSAYQAAGAQGAAMRAMFRSDVTSQFTYVDAQNAALQKVTSHLSTQADASNAQSYVKVIQGVVSDLYKNGFALAAVSTSPPVAASTGSTLSTVAQYLLWGAVIVGIGALGVVMFWPDKVRKNPTGFGPGGRRYGKRTLIKKGRACRFEMKDGGDISAPGAMMHDPSGRWWPKNSVLCGRIPSGERLALRDELSGEAEHYLGNTYPAKIGQVNLPPRHLARWQYRGEVEQIWYTRTGRKMGGERFFHPFNKSMASWIKGGGRVRLYKFGRWYRLELPRGAVLDSRGFVTP